MAPTMNVLGHGWSIWRHPVGMLVAVLLLMVALVGLAYQYDVYQKVKLQQVQNAYQTAQHKLRLAQQAQTDYQQYWPQYQHWMDVGFIGEERRQQWLKRLRQVREQYGLFEIDYDISQQQTDEFQFIKGVAEKPHHHQLYRTVMMLKLGLLHEGDLIHLLSGLAKGTSPFIARDCEVRRISNTLSPPTRLQAHLKAQCEIDWFTLKPLVSKAIIK